ncbi:DUF4377 domain-containing protein [Burkholderia sp. Bp9031]|uniref:DUF4377 domain-containing protein n=1 Tax=Burkholderia sp. Bp9031 TaxID=2184566 RepID=UPI0021AB3CF5|nr:DUF4377 domain-containing protein [Burkholderia sp. Bp9031]
MVIHDRYAVKRAPSGAISCAVSLPARSTGVAPMDCLQVRSSPAEPWSPWYAGIEGFAYQPGYQYVLEVDEYRVAHPPADGSSIRWVLKRVVERRQVN